MDVKLIETPKGECNVQDLEPGDWFVFAGNPHSVCRWLESCRYYREASCDVRTMESHAPGPVVKLELAGVDGQTLLLRRAE